MTGDQPDRLPAGAVPRESVAARIAAEGPGREVAAQGRDIGWEDLEREFPRWHTWQGVSGLWYATRRQTSPPVVVRGEGLTDLRDEIRRWAGNH